MFAVGFCKKVLIADRLGDMVDLLLGIPGSLHLVSAWAAALGYALQIYFNFSGYCDMAIGLGRLFDIELPQNFNNPYWANNPQDFWRRWHITLSTWLRDYVYMPLRGNQKGSLRRALSVLITFFLGGLWHGAQWTFAVWGLYHAFLIIVYYETRTSWDRAPMALQRLITFVLICIGWVFFRAPTVAVARQWLSALVGLSSSGTAVPNTMALILLFLCILGLFLISRPFTASTYDQFSSLDRYGQMILALVCVIAVLYAHMSSRFLYYRF